MKRALLLLCLLTPLPALAQQGLQLSPGVTLSQVYDDDLGPPGVGALFTELTPAATLGYGSQRWTLLSHAALDLEAQDQSPIRTTPYLRGTADALLTGRLTDRLSLTADGAIWDTNTPRDINVATGFDPGEQQANSESGDLGLAYLFSPLTRGSLQAGFVSTAETGLITNEWSGRASYHRMFSVYNGARFDLDAHEFQFVDHETDSVESPMVGWDHHFNPELNFEVLAGPRFDGTKAEGVEGSASVNWLGENVHFTLAAVSTQNAIPGFIGLVDTESALARVVVHPSEKLFLTATPAVYVSAGAPIHAQVGQVRLDAYRQLNNWLALIASYTVIVENARYAFTNNVYDSSVHNQIVVGLSFNIFQPGLPTVWPTADTWNSKVAPSQGLPDSQNWHEPGAPMPTGALPPTPAADPTEDNGAPANPVLAAPPTETQELKKLPDQN